MYPLGHLGCTAGAIFAIEQVARIWKPKQDSSDSTAKPMHKFESFLRHTDFRAVFLGGMLPDLLDKTLGALIFHNSRSFGHSLIFSSSLLLLGTFFLTRWKRGNLLLIGISSSFHILEDRIWRNTNVVLWPFNGFSFPKSTNPGGISQRVNDLADISIYIPEIVGGIILLFLLFRILRSSSIKAFLSNGQIP